MRWGWYPAISGALALVGMILLIASSATGSMATFLVTLTIVFVSWFGWKSVSRRTDPLHWRNERVATVDLDPDCEPHEIPTEHKTKNTSAPWIRDDDQSAHAENSSDDVRTGGVLGQLVTDGIAAAELYSGIAYETGKGVPQNYNKAANWYRYAAEQGSAEAQMRIGRLYSSGRGVIQDYLEAAQWYEMAADQGNIEAQWRLARALDKGNGVPQDIEGALNWYRQSANSGFAPAQHSLGCMYRDGVGIQHDQVEAHLWFNLAAANAKKPDERDTFEIDRDALAEDMDLESIEQAQALARDWITKQAKRSEST